MNLSLDALVVEARARLEVTGRLVGIGWATVELDRAAAAFGLVFAGAPPDEALGAWCRVTRRLDGTALVLLEPSTEGRLAESLARRGEGPVAVWFDGRVADGPALAGSTGGPFGPERLVLGSKRDDPHVFLLERVPATISA